MKKLKSGGGDGSLYMIYILVGILLVFGITFILLILFQKSPNKIIVPKTSNQEASNKFTGFPPCYDLSLDAKHVFQLLKSINMDTKYSQLLNVYSLALCQLEDYRKKCDVSVIDGRLSTLNSLGASSYNVTSNNIVKSITRIKDDTKKVSEFLFKVCDICEKNINKINQDNDVLRPIKIQLTGFNSEFYRTIFDQINNLCPNI